MLVVVFGLWTAYACYLAKDMGPVTKREQYFTDDHYITKVDSLINENFESGLYDIYVNVYWGIKSINRENVDRWNPEDIGDAVLDDEFDLSSIEAQASLVKFCRDLREQEFVFNKNVQCWIEDFQEWYLK